MNRSQTLGLAQWFVRDILGRKWTPADFSGVHMRDAAMLLKNYSMEDIKACIMAMVEVPWPFNLPKDFRFKVLSTITKGEPPYIEQFLAIPDPPPIYEIAEYDGWVLKYGLRAIKEDKWNGVYQPLSERYRLGYDEISATLGKKYADLSLMLHTSRQVQAILEEIK